MTLLFLVGCIAAQGEGLARMEGTLEPRWWGTAPGFGEAPTDGTWTAVVLRLDAPFGRVASVIYSPRSGGDITPDPAAAACFGGHAVVEGRFAPGGTPFADGALEDAKLISCKPHAAPDIPFASGTAATGVLQRRWWYGSPGFGADPVNDRVNLGAVLIVDGAPVPVALIRSDDATFERNRRVLFGCEGQTVTATGDYRPTREPKVRQPYVLADATFTRACDAPRIFQGIGVPPKELPKSWLD